MVIKFIDRKTPDSYFTLLPKTAFIRYCNNPDGLLFAEIKDAPLSKEQAALELTEMLRTCFFLTKRDCVILSLLTDPYFDELCILLKRKDYLLDKRKLRKICKYLFGYLASDSAEKAFNDPYLGPDVIIAGSQVYREKTMHLVSREMLKEIKSRYGI